MIGMMLALVMACQEEPTMYDLVKGGEVASLSTNFKGTPFGSLAPYAIDEKGLPFVFLSDIAQHSENLKKNKKASLMIHKIDKDDLFSSPRIIFVGKLVKVPDKERAAYAKIYLKRNPQAEQIIDFGDFNFYRLVELRTIHYYGGFADSNWIEPADYFKGYKKK